MREIQLTLHFCPTCHKATSLCSCPKHFPEHKGGLFLNHNEHRNYYEKLIDFIADSDLGDAFEDESAMNRAIDADELWVLQWYPNTPVGFNRVAAPTLDEVLRMANKD